MKQCGFILASAVIIMAILSAAALEITKTFASARQKSKRTWQHIQAMETARSGLERLRLELARDINDTDGPGDTWFQPSSFVLNGLPMTVSVRDETGKLNLNRLFYPSGEPNRRLWALFHRLGGPSPNKAYDLFPPPHVCRFQTPGEAKPELLKNIRLPHRLFTVFGPGRININTAPEPILTALPGITASCVRRILRSRREHPFKSPGDLKKRVEMRDDEFRRCFPLLAFRSSYFTVTADVVMRRGRAHAEAIIWRTRSGTVMLRYREWFS